MKTKFYYLRDAKNRPLVSICLLQDEESVARGVAICSPSDSPNKKRGRDIALGRARQALKRGTSGTISREEAEQVCDKLVCGAEYWNLEFKSDLDPELYPLEEKILGVTNFGKP